MSRHNLSQAQQLYAGKVTFSPYQADKLGVELHPLYRWKPTQGGAASASNSGALGAAITWGTAPAAGDTSETLSADWAGSSGLYQITFSSGEQCNGYFTNGSETVNLYGVVPLVGGALNPYTLTQAAATTGSTVAGQPPVVGASTAYATSQSIGAAALANLNGARVINGVGVPDVPRNVVGAWTTDSIITITGTDYYGQPQTEVGASAASFTGKKAFATIISIESSAAITAATFGTGNVLGLPFRVDGGDIYAMSFNEAADAGTFVPADTTPVATSSTGDVRGTYAPAGTLNGAKWLTALLKVADAGTQIGAFGVTPA